MFIIVEHDSPFTCIPPLEAYKYFDQFHFTYLPYSNIGTFNNWKKFNQVLYKIYGEVTSAFIEDETEGSVLYFLHKRKNGKD